MTDVGAIPLARRMETSESVTMLDLASNSIREAGLKEFARVICGRTLQSLVMLDLSDNPYTLRGFNYLIEVKEAAPDFEIKFTGMLRVFLCALWLRCFCLRLPACVQCKGRAGGHTQDYSLVAVACYLLTWSLFVSPLFRCAAGDAQ